MAHCLMPVKCQCGYRKCFWILRIIDLFAKLIFDRAPGQSGHPTWPARLGEWNEQAQLSLISLLENIKNVLRGKNYVQLSI